MGSASASVSGLAPPHRARGGGDAVAPGGVEGGGARRWRARGDRSPGTPRRRAAGGAGVQGGLTCARVPALPPALRGASGVGARETQTSHNFPSLGFPSGRRRRGARSGTPSGPLSAERRPCTKGLRPRLKADSPLHPSGADGVVEGASRPARVAGLCTARSSAPLESLDGVHSSRVWRPRRRLGPAPGMRSGGVEGLREPGATQALRTRREEVGSTGRVLRGAREGPGRRSLPAAVCWAPGAQRRAVRLLRVTD